MICDQSEKSAACGRFLLQALLGAADKKLECPPKILDTHFLVSRIAQIQHHADDAACAFRLRWVAIPNHDGWIRH